MTDTSNAHDGSSSVSGTNEDGDASTRTPSDRVVTVTMVNDLLGWIGANTEYDVSRTLNDPPRIHVH